MLIFAIDDDMGSLQLLHDAIEATAKHARIIDFSTGEAAVRAIEGQGLRPDFVFTEIELPSADGLKLASFIKQSSPMTRLIFVTGRKEYAIDAFRLHVSGFIVKPVTSDRVREELLYYNSEIMQSQEKLKVQCFGYFEVFWRGKPLMFGRKQTKELLAYLIDREGAACTSEEIITAMWSEESDLRAAKGRIRQLISDMKSTLTQVGMEKLLIRRSGQIAISRDMIDCDYYRMLNGDMNAINAFRGEYMQQYSWAELTAARLHFKK